MLKTAFLVTLLACVITNVMSDYNIVCYYNRHATYRPEGGKFELFDINLSLCTHIIYNYIGIDAKGNIKILDPWVDLPSGRDGFRKFTKLHVKNPDVKLMIGIGGWDEGSINFSKVVGNSNTRTQFVQNIVNFLENYNFDGLDLDWVYPNQRGGKSSDRENYVVVLQELRQEFDKHNYILSVTTAALEALASHSYIISQISQHVNFINLMTYDFHGSWERTTGVHAPLYPSSNESGDKAKLNVDSSVQYWLSQGAPANKINLGIPSYGRSFTLNSRNHEIGASAIGGGNAGPYTQKSGFLGYNEICTYLQRGWTVIRESQQHVPYAFKDNQWVGYDDVISVEEKTKYAKNIGLGGMMLWSLDTDDFHGTSGEKYPLLNTINRVLIKDTSSTSTTITTTPPITTPPTTTQPTTTPPTTTPPTTTPPTTTPPTTTPPTTTPPTTTPPTTTPPTTTLLPTTLPTTPPTTPLPTTTPPTTTLPTTTLPTTPPTTTPPPTTPSPTTPLPTITPPTTTPPPTTPPPTPSPTTPIFDPICTHEGMIANPYDCTKYFTCKKVGNQYIKYSSHCTSGSAFNPITETCDDPSNVPNC